LFGHLTMLQVLLASKLLVFRIVSWGLLLLHLHHYQEQHVLQQA
jgi:hypothetical protein